MAALDKVPTEAATEAEVTTRSELERQEAEALRLMLIRKARKEAAESAAFTAAAIVEGGMRYEAAELAARCSAALSLAAKGYGMKLTDTEWADLRADLLALALEWGAEADTERAEGGARGHLARRLRRILSGPWGGAAEARYCEAEREAARLLAVDRLPRAEDAPVARLAGAARNLLKGRAKGYVRTGAAPADDSEAPATTFGSDLAAADLAEALNASEREALALRSAVEGASLAELGAEVGKTAKATERAAAKGREALAARLSKAEVREAVLTASGQAERPALRLSWHRGPLHGPAAEVIRNVDRVEAEARRYGAALREADEARRLAPVLAVIGRPSGGRRLTAAKAPERPIRTAAGALAHLARLERIAGRLEGHPHGIPSEALAAAEVRPWSRCEDRRLSGPIPADCPLRAEAAKRSIPPSSAPPRPMTTAAAMRANWQGDPGRSPRPAAEHARAIYRRMRAAESRYTVTTIPPVERTPMEAEGRAPKAAQATRPE